MSSKVSNKNNQSWNKKLNSKNIITSNIITTPYEKVLSILKEVKNFITNFSKNQNKLIQNLDWVIKIITSRSLYSYELKEKETINKLSKDNPEFKQLVDFVSEYNEKVIKMSRQYNYILADKLLQQPSTKLNRRRIERKSSFAKKSSKFSDILSLDDFSNKQLRINTKIVSNKNNNFRELLGFNKNKVLNNTNTHLNTISNSNINKISNKLNNYTSVKSKKNKNDTNPFDKGVIKKTINKKKEKQKSVNINDEENNYNIFKNRNNNLLFFNNQINYQTHNSANIEEDSIKKLDKKSKKINLFPSVQTITININNNDNANNNTKETSNDSNDYPIKRTNTSINAVNISLTNSIVCEKKTLQKRKHITNKNLMCFRDYSFVQLQNQMLHEGHDSLKIINEKNFDVFHLKDLIGYNNVLPFTGRMILENLGLIDEEILNVDKLDDFLVSVNNQYKEDTLYHNSLHGADVTQSCYIFLSHSNAEKIAKTNVLDLLSIFIAALGHDIGHPGLTNTFHINDSTDMAITYNDISVLENFHASTLFKTIRKNETNIFEKLTTIDYKIIRKRMISEILATDMANHAKVISLIKSKIALSDNGKDHKLNLLTGNEQTKNDEQQCLLDFIVHVADLAHNTRLFSISLKWVELLSEEFWKQGDLEKQYNLPVSFLCDREKINIPQSQKGFISGFIIPTYECLCDIFPTLKFTLDNANKNLKEWQQLLNEGRLKGWTPPKKNERENNNKKIITKGIDTNKVVNIASLKVNDNKKNNEIKKSKINTINIINISDKNSINDNCIKSNRESHKKDNKLFNINENLRKSNKKTKKNFNTPVKLRISDNFSFFNDKNDKNNNEFLLLSSRKKENKGSNEGLLKKIVYKNANKKNVNKIKKQ